jgi:hypothetical protein
MQLDELHTGLRYDSRIGDGSLRLYNRRNVHRFSGHEKYKRMSLLVTIFLSFIFFPAMWIIAGGTCSSIPYYIIVNAGIIALLLTGITRKIVFALFALMVSGLITFEYRRPDFVILNYDSEFVRYIDLSFGLFVCLFAIAVLIAVLIDSYMAELQRSKRYLLALEEKNREIEARIKPWKKAMRSL